MQIENNNCERVVVYIDGFNLYFGMVEAGFENCKWLDLNKLIDKLLKPNQKLIEIKYFTSRVTNNPDKQKRQSTYIDALETKGVNIIYGKYQDNKEECTRCGNIWRTAKEKMTDVNIATSMIIDAYEDKFDVAFLVSGDSDLVPPINAIHNHFNKKRVVIAFPPKRHNSSMALVAKGSLIIGRKTLIDSQLEEVIKSKTGYNLKKPVSWKSE